MLFHDVNACAQWAIRRIGGESGGRAPIAAEPAAPAARALTFTQTASQSKFLPEMVHSYDTVSTE